MKLLAAFASVVFALLVLGYFAAKSGEELTSVSLPPPLPPKDPVSELEKRINLGVKTGNWTAFDMVCDLDAFLKRIIGSTTLSEPLRECLTEMVKGGGLFGQKEKNGLRELLGEARDWKLIKVRMLPDGPRPVFRILGRGGYANYVEFVLAESWAAPVRVVDANLLLLGELASEGLRRTYIPAPAALEVLNSLKAPTPLDLFMTKGERFKLIELGREGKLNEAEEYFTQHWNALREDKTAHLCHLAYALALGPDVYARAFEAFESQFPNDPSLPIFRLRHHRVRGKFGQALEAVDRISQELENPFWDVLRSAINLEARRFPEAESLARKCTIAEPELPEAWYALAAVALAKEDFVAAAGHLEAGDKSATLEIRELKALAGFEGFSSTEACRKWMASRKSK